MNRIYPIILLIFALAIANEDYTAASSLFDAGSFGDAQSRINVAISAEPENAQFFFLASKIAFKLDKLDEAWDHLLKAIDLDLDNTEFREESTRLTTIKNSLSDAKKSFDNGYYDESISGYERINNQIPDFAMPYYLKGMVYYTQKDYDMAAESIKDAIKHNPFEDKYKAALSNVVAILYNEGNDYFDRNDFEEATKKYEKALVINPQFTEALFKLAYLNYKLGDYQSCLNYLDRNIQIDPTSYKAFKLMGDTYNKMGDVSNAIASYINSTQANSQYDKAYYALGQTYHTNGENDKAIKALSQCVEINPTYGKGHETLGAVYQSVDKLDEAISSFESAILNNSKTKSVYYRLASAYNIKKDYENARAAAKSSLNIDQNYPAAHFELGMAEKCLGNKPAAKNAFEQAAKNKSWRKNAEFELKYIDQKCE